MISDAERSGTVTQIGAGLSPRRAGFNLRLFQVGLLADRVIFGQGFLLELQSCTVSIIPTILSTYRSSVTSVVYLRVSLNNTFRKIRIISLLPDLQA